MSVLDLTSFKKAVASLTSAVQIIHNKEFIDALEDDQKNLMISGVVQNFEFTYELCWKFMKRWLEHNLGSDHVDGVSRRELFRLGAEHKLIDDVDEWMNFHRARNQTSHTYDEETADEVCNTAVDFVHRAVDLVARLEAKND